MIYYNALNSHNAKVYCCVAGPFLPWEEQTGAIWSENQQLFWLFKRYLHLLINQCFLCCVHFATSSVCHPVVTRCEQRHMSCFSDFFENCVQWVSVMPLESYSWNISISMVEAVDSFFLQGVQCLLKHFASLLFKIFWFTVSSECQTPTLLIYFTKLYF